MAGAARPEALSQGDFAENPWRDAAGLLGRKIRAHLGAILFTALACAALAGMAKTVLPASYKASAQILIDPQEARSFEVEPQQSSLDANAAINYVESQMGVIGSERVLLRVIRDQGLAGSPPPAQGVADSAGESAETRSFRELAENRVLLKLQKAVAIGRAERSFLVNLTVTDASPEQAAALANALVKAYGEINTIDRNAAARRLAADFNSRVEAARRVLNDSESKLQNYKVEHNLVGLHDKSITERRVTEATDALTSAETKEAQARARLKQLEGSPSELGAVSAFGPDPESRQLQVMVEGRAAARSELENQESTFGDRHPAVIAGRARLHEFDRRIATAVEGLRRSTRAQLAEAQGQTALLNKKLANIADELSKARESDVALREMEETLEARRKGLTALEGKQRDANDMSRLEGPSFRIVSPARIPNIQGHGGALVLWSVFGALIGAAMAIAWLAAQAIFEESGRPTAGPARRIRDAHDFRETSAAPAAHPLFIAQLPAIAPTGGRRALQASDALNEAGARPRSSYSVAVEALYDRLSRRKGPAAAGQPIAILVAGTEPEAGASTLAANLARVAARRGQRVLLIDAHRTDPALDRLIPTGAPKTLIELAGRWRPLYRLAPFAQSLSLLPSLEDEERLCRDIADEAAYRRIVGVNGNFDVVIFDGPDAGQDKELRALFPAVTKILLVAPDETADPRALPQLLRRLEAPAEKIAGFVRGAPVAGSVAA